MSPPRFILYCSFCGKSEAEVRKLVAGPCVFICDECSDLIAEMMKDPNIGDPLKFKSGEDLRRNILEGKKSP